MAQKQFQAESKRLLDLMIHSIYTNKEIFLREIISNASDAIDKRYFKASSAGKTGLSREDYPIHVAADKDARTLTISDNGIGMTEKELEDNLGVIAQSGSFDFKTENAESDGTDCPGYHRPVRGGLLLRLHGEQEDRSAHQSRRQRPGLSLGIGRG